MNKQHFLALGLALLVLAGCGQPPQTAPRPRHLQPLGPRVQDVRLPQQAPHPMMPMRPAMQDEGAMLKEAAMRAVLESQGIEAEIRSYSEGHYKKGERVDELRKSSSRLVWVKPAYMWGEIVETTPDAIMQRLGAPTAVWRAVGNTQIDGTPVKVIAIENARPLGRAITREMV